MTEQDKRIKAFENLYIMLKRIWKINEDAPEFEGDYLYTFHRTDKPSIEGMGWAKLNLTLEEIQNVGHYFISQSRKMYPTALEIAIIARGDPEPQAHEAWTRIRALLTDHQHNPADIGCGPDTICGQALESVGHLYYLRNLSFRDLRLAEQDFIRMYLYYWKRSVGVEP